MGQQWTGHERSVSTSTGDKFAFKLMSHSHEPKYVIWGHHIFLIEYLLAVADARRSFLEGSAFQSAPIEKTAEEIEFKSEFFVRINNVSVL